MEISTCKEHPNLQVQVFLAKLVVSCKSEITKKFSTNWTTVSLEFSPQISAVIQADVPGFS